MFLRKRLSLVRVEMTNCIFFAVVAFTSCWIASPPTMMACLASPSTVVGIAVHLVATTQRRMCLYLFSFANLLQQHTHHFLLQRRREKIVLAVPCPEHHTAVEKDRQQKRHKQLPVPPQP